LDDEEANSMHGILQEKNISSNAPCTSGFGVTTQRRRNPQALIGHQLNEEADS
jgi:hypothetical protein